MSNHHVLHIKCYRFICQLHLKKDEKQKRKKASGLLYTCIAENNTDFNETLLHLQIYCLPCARYWGHQVNYDMVSYGAQSSGRDTLIKKIITHYEAAKIEISMRCH